MTFHLPKVNIVAYGFNVLVTYGTGAAGWFKLPSNAETSAKYQVRYNEIGPPWAFGSVATGNQSL